MVDGARIRHSTSFRRGNHLTAANTMPDVSLPEEAKAVIWRILGAGESPLTKPSTFDLIEPVIRKHVSSSARRDWAISEIRGWFEPMGARRWLKSGMRETVAAIVVEGIGTDRSETSLWAVGSIDGDLAASVIGCRWRAEEIDSFVDAVLATLEKLRSRDEVLNAAGMVPFADTEHGTARIPRDAVQRRGTLETFRHLGSHGFDLIHCALHLSVGNLIELVINLRPERFETLIERLDHPVMQARAAYHMVAVMRALDHRKPLLWITKKSCDALIALAIVHTLETVNRLDEDVRSSARLIQDRPSTELRTQQETPDTAAVNLLNDLVDRLATLDPLACARWIGELLSTAPYALVRRGDSEKPPRLEQLEEKGVELLAHLVGHSWSADLVAVLCAGLCLTPRETWPRHLAAVAWRVRDGEPGPAITLARRTLDELERRVAEELEQGHLFLNWTDWHDREWIAGLGAALALSIDEIDLPNWVSMRCRALPLSVWDAEENYQAFSTADRAAQIWFLVGLHAVACLKQIDRAVDPAQVRALAEAVWSHCYFAGQHLADGRDASVASEHAARSAVEFGKPSDLWLLEQAHSRRVGPRALWALIDQRNNKASREPGSDGAYSEMIGDEVVLAASNRFGEGEHFGIESLHYWGRLWLLTGAVAQARRTAKAILKFPMRDFDRSSKVLVLELLTLGTDGQGLDQETRQYVGSTYRELWPTFGYTPDTERASRQRIDERFKQLGVCAP